MIPFLVLFGLGTIVVLFIIIGMALDDIQDVKTKRAFKEHPHARKWRNRPQVDIVVNDTVSDELLGSIRRSSYKKLCIADATSDNSNLRLTMTGNVRLARSTVQESVRRLNTNPTTQAVGFTPVVKMPSTTMELFRTYALLAHLPFISARSGFNIPSQFSLSKPGSEAPRAFAVSIAVLKWSNVALFIYGCYAAALLSQPELVLLYMCSLAFWLTWSILRYPYFSFAKKVALLILSPAAFVYFILLAIASPFGPLTKQASRQNAIIKV